MSNIGGGGGGGGGLEPPQPCTPAPTPLSSCEDMIKENGLSSLFPLKLKQVRLREKAWGQG